MKCPGIDEYVMFRTHQTVFYFKALIEPKTADEHAKEKRLISPIEGYMEKQDVVLNTDKEEQVEPTLDAETIMTTSEFNTPDQDTQYEVCYGKASDFEKMLQTFWPKIARYIHEKPTHDHSKQWQQWISQGLHSGTDLAQFKQLNALTLSGIIKFIIKSKMTQPMHLRMCLMT
jgi:hypothetical protein